jgi:hypothetical protein
VNAHRSLILITSLLLATSLTGCASFGFGPKVKPVQILSKPVERTPLDITLPEPIRTKPIEWVVITPDNVEDVFKKLEESGQNLVLFALTDDGYQQLALTIADLRNFMNTQRTIIIKYKEYYEPQTLQNGK